MSVRCAYISPSFLCFQLASFRCSSARWFRWSCLSCQLVVQLRTTEGVSGTAINNCLFARKREERRGDNQTDIPIFTESLSNSSVGAGYGEEMKIQLHCQVTSLSLFVRMRVNMHFVTNFLIHWIPTSKSTQSSMFWGFFSVFMTRNYMWHVLRY